MPALLDRPPLLLTVEEAARELRLSRSKVYELMSAGEIKSVTIGRSRRVPSEATAEYVSRLIEES
jgi:excisionase family DNA binding protein